MAMNNDVADKDGKPAGEPTELALFEAAHQAGFEKAVLEQASPRTGVIPFDSERKLMTTLHRVSEAVVAYTKGAPEQVLARCSRASGIDGLMAFEPEVALAEATQLADEGYRVLAFAKRELSRLPEPLQPRTTEQELTFLGLVALIDPPRPEAAQAVADCLTAGITPVMITGD
ncbi:MAG: ATPase, partial [Pseudomonas stutzeri]|nr:ATPase [Stutzerimonas stutzeri]